VGEGSFATKSTGRRVNWQGDLGTCRGRPDLDRHRGAAEWLGVPVEAVRAAVQAGELPALTFECV
jgi:hypothetical protein